MVRRETRAAWKRRREDTADGNNDDLKELSEEMLDRKGLAGDPTAMESEMEGAVGLTRVTGRIEALFGPMSALDDRTAEARPPRQLVPMPVKKCAGDKVRYPLEIVTILHPRPRDTGKFAAQGPNIMSPKGGNMQPAGDIIWPAGGKFTVSQGQGCRISNIIW